MRERLLVLGSTSLLAPLIALGLTHCTFSGLDALGTGGLDGSLPNDSGSSSFTDTGSDSSTGVTPPVDSGSHPQQDSATPPDDSGSVDDDAGPPVPPQAAPVFIDAGVAHWCTLNSAHTFCADFDTLSLPAGFSGSDGAYLYQTSSLASSAPNDLLMFNPGTNSTTSSWGSKLALSFSVQATTMVLAFDFYPEIIPQTAGCLFAGLDLLGNADAKYSIRLAYNTNQVRLEESYLGSPPDVPHKSFSIPLNAWGRLQVQLTFLPYGSDGGSGADGGGATYSVYLSGELMDSGPLSPPAAFDHRPNLLVGGVYGASPTPAWAFRYDNVTFDIQ